MNTPILQHLLKVLISLLLALVPFYTLLAQVKEQKTDKTVKVKMFKSVDGKLYYSKDTIINAADHEKQLKVLKDIKFDAKTWKKLDASKIRLDSIKAINYIRTPSAITYTSHDTVVFERLKGAGVYKIQHALSDKDRVKVFEKIQGAKGDTFFVKALKGKKIIMLRSDSTHGKRFKTMALESAAGRTFSIVHTNTGGDSAHVMLSIAGENGVLIKDGEMLKAGNFTARYATSDKIKIETDESGKTTVYEVDENGNKKEIDAYHFGKSGEKSTVILLNRTKVEDITKEDKKALKEAGVKVEKSTKKELKVDNLSYYPNPSNGRLNVSFTLPDKGEAIVRVLNSAGKEVYQEKISNPSALFEKQIDVSGYGKGIFYLQVAQNGKTLTKRLLVQ